MVPPAQHMKPADVEAMWRKGGEVARQRFVDDLSKEVGMGWFIRMRRRLSEFMGRKK